MVVVNYRLVESGQVEREGGGDGLPVVSVVSNVSKVPVGLGSSPCFFLNQGLGSPQISF